MALAIAMLVVVQPFALYVAPNGTTTGPATPALPLWMWEAFGLPILAVLSSQQTFCR